MNFFQITKSARALMAEARVQTDIDLMDDRAEEPLQRMLESLNTEAELSQAGAVGMEHRLLRLLRNRLRMQRDFQRHPEIEDQQILRPVILAGGPRTGTTKLQNLLAASGDFQFLPFWRGHNLSLDSGDRTESPAGRIRRAEEDVRWFDERAPEAKLTHPFHLFDADEESLILEHHLCSPFISFFAFVPRFMQWVASQDFNQQIEFVRRGLKYLQWQFSDGDPRPWVLKCPIYGGAELLLAEAYPCASFIINHREPHKTVSSTASLVHQYGRAYSAVDRRPAIGPMFLEALAAAAERQMEVRDRCEDLTFVDVHYIELTQDVIAVAEQIYRRSGINLTGRAITAMAEWDRNNQQHQHGTHRYTLEEFGLSQQAVDHRYRAYIDRFGCYF